MEIKAEITIRRNAARQEEIQAFNRALAFFTSDAAHDLFIRTLDFVQLRNDSDKLAAVK